MEQVVVFRYRKQGLALLFVFLFQPKLAHALGLFVIDPGLDLCVLHLLSPLAVSIYPSFNFSLGAGEGANLPLAAPAPSWSLFAPVRDSRWRSPASVPSATVRKPRWHWNWPFSPDSSGPVFPA